MAFVWDLRKSQKHNTIEMPVNARVLATFQVGYTKALGGLHNIRFYYEVIRQKLLQKKI